MATQAFSVAFLDFLDETLFMPNEILERFIKKFSRIDKKFDSQSILEVGYFTSVKKMVFFQNLDIVYRKSYSKLDRF